MKHLTAANHALPPAAEAMEYHNSMIQMMNTHQIAMSEYLRRQSVLARSDSQTAFDISDFASQYVGPFYACLGDGHRNDGCCSDSHSWCRSGSRSDGHGGGDHLLPPWKGHGSPAAEGSSSLHGLGGVQDEKEVSSSDHDSGAPMWQALLLDDQPRRGSLQEEEPQREAVATQAQVVAGKLGEKNVALGIQVVC